ncbi:hypothetical protein [Sphingomonas sp. R86520]|uniref:hypothetical protein n=1 Tax=Sphingomonas sp. R86520 TaxID=3093859 RepID=UPI0036D381BD
MKSATAFAVSLLLSTFVPAIAAGQSAGPSSGPSSGQSIGLEDMVGARAGQAEAEVRHRGYTNIRAEKGDDRSYAYWWNADRRQCVVIATMEGRYNSIQATTPPDCRKPANLRLAPGYATHRPQPGYQPEPGYLRPPNHPGSTQLGYPLGGPVIDGRSVGLGLVCFGDGSKSGIARGTAWTWNRDRDRYEYGTYNQTTREVFDASLMVQTWDGGGRIRLPRSLIPPINSRGNNGWWDLYDVVSGPDVIRATYRLNGLNKPRIVIDRRTGRITVQGTASYGFRGSCDVIGHETRKF